MNIEQLQTRLEALEKRIHYMRIAIVVLVGFFVYDVLSADGLGAPQQIVRGTVKAQEFILLDDNQAQVGQWKGNNESGGPELSMYGVQKYRSSLSAQSLNYYAGNKLDSLKKLEIDQTGIKLHADDGTLRMRLGDSKQQVGSSETPPAFALYKSDGELEFQAP